MAEEKLFSKLMDPSLFDDGTGEAVEAAAKQKEEIAKQAAKDLEDKANIIDEINDAKASVLKVKGLTEKLTLDESDSFEEALPKDLAKAYKNNPYRIGSGKEYKGYKNINAVKGNYPGVDIKPIGYDRTNTDFQNSNYTEITPEEALALKKSGKADKLRIIFDNQLVAFTPEGKPLYKASSKYGSVADLYQKGDKEVEHTTLLPFKEIINRASKIYLADEKPIDQELLDSRMKNPESRFFPTQGVDSLVGIRASAAFDYLESSKWEMYHAKTAVDNAKEQFMAATTNEKKEFWANNLAASRNRYELAKKKYSEYLQKVNNLRAARRNYNSKVDLQAVFKEFKDVRDEYTSTKEQLAYATKELDTARAKGSPEVAKRKRELELAQADLKRINTQIARLEMYLESADEDNEAALKEYSDTVNEYSNKLDEIQTHIKSILKREGLETSSGEQLKEAKVMRDFYEYEPWSGAVDTFNKIKEAEKLEELDALIDELYPEGIDETQLNDILWFEPDWILETLGIKGEEDE